MCSLEWHRTWRNQFVVILAVGLSYFAAAFLNLALATGHHDVTPVWPSSGIAVAAVLVLGPRALPGVWLGQFAINFLELRSGHTAAAPLLAFLTAAGVGCVGTLQAAIARLLVRRLAGPQFLNNGRGTFRFLMLAGPLSCAVASGIGPALLCAAGVTAWHEFGRMWFTWWTGESIGVVAVAPVLLAWRQAPRVSFRSGRLIEAAVLAVYLVASLLGGFKLVPTGPLAGSPLPFIYLPGLAWAAMRFGPRGASTATLTLSAVAVLATAHGCGPFAGRDVAESLMLLQLYLGVMSGTTLIVAAITTERQSAQEELAALNARLESHILARTAELESANDTLRMQAVERQRVEEALRREAVRLAAVVAVQDAIASTPPDLDAVLRMIAQRAKDLAGAPTAAVGFPDGDEFALRVSTDGAAQPSFRVKLDRSLSGQCLRTGQVVHCNDTLADDRADQEACRRSGTRSLILLPLRRDGIPAAVLMVYSPEPDVFDAADVKALQLMAGFVEGVMAKAAAFEEKRALLDERTATLEALREAQERFVTFMDNSPSLCFIHDEHGRYVYVNKAFERRFGGSVDDWIGKTVFERFPPDVARRMQESLDRTLEADQKLELTEDVPTLDGMCHCIVFKFPLRDARGRRYVAGEAIDITGRKRAEAALRDQERLFRQVLDALPVGVIITNPDWRIVRSNPAAERIWGGVRQLGPDERAQFKGWWTDTGKPVLPDEWAMCYALSRRESSPVQRVDIEALDGSRKTIETCAEPVLDEQQQLVAGVCVIEDVTDRRKAEQALAASERFARATVDALTTEMAILDEGGTIVAVNQAWRQFAEENGQNPLAAGLGVNYLAVCDRASGEDAELAAAAARGIRRVMSRERDEFYLEYPCHSPQTERWFAMRVTRFGSEGVTRFVVAHENITARRIAARLERERAGLRDAVSAMDRVLGVVGHELRTPLAATRVTAELLLMDGMRQADEGEKLLRSVHDEVVRMGTMVNDLLEVARLNSGTTKWNWSTVLLAKVCEEAAASVQPLIDPTRVELRVESATPGLIMRGDPEAIRRLVINLLSNAYKHTPAGSIRVSVTAKEDGGERYVQLEVADTGTGMSQEVAARLGEAFVLNSGMIGGDYVKGSGLGLAICKGIVGAHGGRISVASAKGAGTTVAVLLRADLAEPVSHGPGALISVEAVN
jgi:PAS domain S-box-containing protein